ncbi:MAG TPA: zinc-ribbon domain-containing protein [Pirellulales bacterium]|jgi:ribosomal protein L7/L12|nr:zinc-ribbon domain-containing protein [Pirellulales bacterium]
MPRCSACGKKNLPGFAFCQKCGMPLEGDGGVPEPAHDSPFAPTDGAGGNAGELDEQISQLLHQGHKIQAIRLYRERTGAGLAEAKQAVEQMQVDVVFAESSLEEQLLNLLRQGRKIAAIKAYRERTRCGLKEAKDTIEALAARHGIEARGAGCASMVLLGLALVGLAWSVVG